jgi:hypothetical protein
MLWMGKPLNEYSKGELMVIIELLAKMQRAQYDQHAKDLKIINGKGD